jgi:hypothetical protein
MMDKTIPDETRPSEIKRQSGDTIDSFPQELYHKNAKFNRALGADGIKTVRGEQVLD